MFGLSFIWVIEQKPQKWSKVAPLYGTLKNYANGTWTEVNKRVTIGHWKMSHKQSCDTSFLGQFVSIMMFIWRYDVIRLDWTAEVRSMSGQISSNFEINIFAFNAHVCDSECSQDSKYVISCLLRWLEIPKNASPKNDVTSFSWYIALKTPKIVIYLWNLECV